MRPAAGRLWVKVCGLTAAEAVDAAVQAQVDAVGFVFARSPRQVTTSQASRLAAALPGHIAKVAVMLHPSQTEVDEVCEHFGPDLLQTDAGDFSSLRVPQLLQRLPVLRQGQTAAMLPERFLFEGLRSGQGEVADWQQAADLAHRATLILAGGLTPANVSAAIRAVHPAGVDVSSGVEVRPGEKDPMKIHEFVQQARAAADGASR